MTKRGTCHSGLEFPIFQCKPSSPGIGPRLESTRRFASAITCLSISTHPYTETSLIYVFPNTSWIVRSSEAATGSRDNCLPQTLPLGGGRDSKSPAGSRVPFPSSKGPEATRLRTLVSFRRQLTVGRNPQANPKAWGQLTLGRNPQDNPKAWGQGDIADLFRQLLTPLTPPDHGHYHNEDLRSPGSLTTP